MRISPSRCRADRCSRAPLVVAIVLAAIVVTGCSPSPQRPSFDPHAPPGGAVGASIVYGRTIIIDTPHAMHGYVRARMSCEACHLEGGTKAKGGSFVGTFTRFPQWNKRAHRVIALQDRLAECFLYSMNGRAPGYSSKAMVAMVAYIAWLSRGLAVGTTDDKEERYIEPLPARAPNAGHGARIYAHSCIRCHRADGNGVGLTYPPLWGPDSFNSGAGMAHIDRMTGFVHHNMPQNAPGSLSIDDAYDVAAFVLRHARPHFKRNVLVQVSPKPAGFF